MQQNIVIYFIFIFVRIEYTFCQQFWHSNYLDESNRNEELTVKNVSVDVKFSLNFTVNYWKSLNIRNGSYAVGIGEDQMVIMKLTRNGNSHNLSIESHWTALNSSYVDATLFDIYDNEKRKNDIILVTITREGRLDWFFIDDVDLFWTWNVGYQVKKIQFGINNALSRNQLFIASENELNVYNFAVKERKIWLTETVYFSNTIGSFAVATYRNQFYVLVTQKLPGELQMFSHIDGRFQSYKNLSAVDIEQVVVFQENFKTFFAIDGLDAGIYQFGKRRSIFKKRIGNSHLEGVKYWLPIIINNLSNNLILFAQRLLDHGSHKSIVTEIFTYNGENFEEHDDIPCQMFGENFNNLHCLNDEQMVGIRGAAAVSVGKGLWLFLAKRYPHSLYHVEFETRRPENPLERELKILNNTKNRLQELLNEKLKTTDQYSTESKVNAENVVPVENMKGSAYKESPTLVSENQLNDPVLGDRISIDLPDKLDEMLSNLEALREKMLRIEQLEKLGKFKKLIINGPSDIRNAFVNQVTTVTINGEPTEETVQDIVRRDEEKLVSGTKTFSDLDVEDLNFETVNGNKASDILFKSLKSLEINGNLTFEKPVSILQNIEVEWINHIPSSGILDLKSNIPGVLAFETIDVGELQTGEINKLPISDTWFHSSDNNDLNKLTEDHTIYIPHNLTVKRVNSEDFESLKKYLCLVNIETHLPGKITIHGDVTVEEPSSTEFLNEVKFPEDYLFEDSSSGVIISGQKSFSDTLRGDEVRTSDQYLNGVKTQEYITLSTRQQILGRAIFNNLEITGQFEHDGKTIGDQISKFLPNPTMRETKTIKSNVHFEELEVTGSIIVEENLNDLSLSEVLEDIVYKDEENPTIYSIKEFPEGLTVRKDLTITSNAINLIPLDQIVTKNTFQFLNIAQLNGNVSIETMEIHQLINGINITKLDQETVKIFGEQFISSTLVFKEDLNANNLEIVEKLNEIPVKNFLASTGDRIIKEGVIFDEIQAENILVNGNFNGNIQEIDLENFVENRMSYTTEQNIDTDFTVENSDVTNMKCNEIGSVNCDILDVNKVMEKVLNKISSGEIVVEDLTVNDGLNIERLDGILVTELRELEENSITIHGNVHFSNIEIAKLSDVDFRVFMENVVFKNESNISMRDRKLFQNGFTVNKLIESETLNSVPIENLLTKEGIQTITAPIEIVGNVTFKSNVTILDTINEISVGDIMNYFEMNDDIYVIKGDIMFDRLSHIYNFELMGYLNNENAQILLDSIAYTTKNLSFTEELKFMEKVTFGGSLDIKNKLNDVDLSAMNDNIVYIMDKSEKSNVESVVTFTGPLTFAHSLVIETDLVTKWIYGIDLETWKNDCVFINKGFLQGTYHFENVTIHDKLSTKFINSVCMNRTIPLGTDQEIHWLNFKNVVFLNNVSVGNFVNGLDLRKEYTNTVLSNEEQEITSNINFHNNTLIRNNLEIAGLLNDQPISKIVTTTTNQNLTALYQFPTKINLNSSLYVSGLINSINMSVWENGAVKMISKEPQEIRAPWHVVGNLTFDESLDGESIIYSFEMDKKFELMQSHKLKKIEIEEQFKKDQEFICKDIRYLSEKLKKQIYRFETFDELLTLHYPLDISKTYFFMDNEPILLINGAKSCKSDLFIFRNDDFVKVSEVLLGEIDQILSVHHEDLIHLVVKVVPNPSCDIDGTNVWKYNNFTVQKIQNIEDQQLLQESLVPSTFYSLNKYGVTEFKIDVKRAVVVFPYRKWKIREDNMAFVPRFLGSGLAVRTGQKLIKLLRDDPIVDNEIEDDDAFLRGEMKTFDNQILPGKNNSELIVVRVGPKNMKRSLLAIVFHEDTVVETNLDSIKIYESYSIDKVFQKISTYNPTSLSSLEFENGETLLLILENREKLQIYQYSGNEGFKRRLSADIYGNYMFKMQLPLDPSQNNLETVGIVDRNKIRILKPVMLGNNMNARFEC